MVQGGQILKQVINKLQPNLIPGKTTEEIDQEARSLIHKYGGQTSFDRVEGYQWATCLSVNEIVVHGVPNNTSLKKGDLLKLDVGVFNKGYHIDFSDTYLIDEKEKGKVKRFLDCGRQTLQKIIKLSQAGTHLGLISQTINQEISQAGYQVILDLTGHTIGRKLHMDPLIPQFLQETIEKTPCFKIGQAYALEVIYSFKDARVNHANDDGWSLKTKHNSLSACFENTIFIEPKQTLILVN